MPRGFGILIYASTPEKEEDEEGKKKKADEILHQCFGVTCWRKRGCSDSQFSIFEGADEDVVLLHGGIFVAVGGDDLVAPKQEAAVQSSGEVTACG